MTKQKSAQKPASASTPERIAEMIRVDHAGEHGAVRIYDGQLAVFAHVPGMEKTADLIREMAQHEQTHLDHFDQLITLTHKSIDGTLMKTNFFLRRHLRLRRLRNRSTLLRSYRSLRR